MEHSLNLFEFIWQWDIHLLYHITRSSCVGRLGVHLASLGSTWLHLFRCLPAAAGALLPHSQSRVWNKLFLPTSPETLCPWVFSTQIGAVPWTDHWPWGWMCYLPAGNDYWKVSRNVYCVFLKANLLRSARGTLKEMPFRFITFFGLYKMEKTHHGYSSSLKISVESWCH